MTKSDLVAKFLEEQFNLPVKRGTYHRNSRRSVIDYLSGDYDAFRWEMKVDMTQFPQTGCRKLKVVKGVIVKDKNQKECISTLGYYDCYYNNRTEYIVGSDFTLKDILETIKEDGFSYIGITYRNGRFNIVIYSIPLAYKGEYCENMF